MVKKKTLVPSDSPVVTMQHIAQHCSGCPKFKSRLMDLSQSFLSYFIFCNPIVLSNKGKKYIIIIIIAKIPYIYTTVRNEIQRIVKGILRKWSIHLCCLPNMIRRKYLTRPEVKHNLDSDVPWWISTWNFRAFGAF